VEQAIHRFVRFLRARGVRVSSVELVHALEALREVELGDREMVRAALSATLLKDRRDLRAFEEVFERFFRLRRVEDPEPAAHSHGHDDLRDESDADRVTLSDAPGDTPEQGHSHGAPSDIRDFFDPEDLAEQFNLHQEANKIDLAALSDEVVLSNEQDAQGDRGDHVEIEVAELRNAGLPSTLSDGRCDAIDADLSVAEQQALLAWMAEELDLDADELVELRERASGGLVDQLPELLRRYLQQLMALDDRVLEGEADVRRAPVAAVDEDQRQRIEDELRRLGRALGGGLTHRRRPGRRGRIDVGRTMRRNMRNDGVPFKPVTVARVEDRPHLVLLVDISLSVRTSARFTLEVVHQLQSLFTRVRTFAFVGDLVEITELFSDHHLEEALEILMGGDVIDVDAQSDYGRAFTTFEEEHANSINRRTTLLVLGDGRSNGKPPGLEVFAQLAERARHVIWWTPEPRRTWALGRSELSSYAAHCDAVEVVRGAGGLERSAERLADDGARG
jgi:uncharacterized protein